MKKIISVILIVSIFISNMSFVMADEVNKNGNYIYVVVDDLGRYVSNENKVTGLKAKETKEKGIYELKDGTLISETGTEYYQKVKKYEAYLSDKEAINELLNNPNLGKMEKNDILESSNRANSNDTEAKVIVFLPELSRTRGTTTRYYAYNGYNMKETLIVYTNINTDTIKVEEGKAALAAAEVIFGGTLVAAGTYSTPVTLVLSGATLIADFINGVNGSVPTTNNTQDRVEIQVFYNRYNKYTYVEDEQCGYQLGAVTQRIELIESEIEQSFVVNYVGEIVETTKQHDEIKNSQYYTDPNEKAVWAVTSHFATDCVDIPSPIVRKIRYKIEYELDGNTITALNIQF